MSFKTKIIITVFFITIMFMTGLPFGLDLLKDQPRNIILAAFGGSGFVLSILISIILLIFTRRIKGKKDQPAKKAQQEDVFDEKAVQVLSILQKKGRLIDFLKEDISDYEDGQIGAAVRSIHKECREAVDEYMNIETVMSETEGDEVTIEEGFDPSTIRLTGNVAGSPPFKGVLRHSGWRVSKTGIPQLPDNQDLSIIEPAEVEII